MKSLIFFELKKIIGRRMTILAILGAILMSILFFIFDVADERHFNSDIQTLHGLEAILFDQEVMRELKGHLTDAYINKREAERAAIENNPNNLEKIPDKELVEKKKEMREVGFSETEIANVPTMKLKDDVYIRELDKYDFLGSHVGLSVIIPKIISELENDEMNKIYDRRSGRFSNAKRPSLADKETSKLLSMYKQVDKHYYYDYYFGWDRLSASFSGFVAIVLSAVIVICLSPVFSQEYSNHTDAIMLPTKYGKNKVIVAKLVSSLIFTTAAYLLFAAINLGLYAAVYGLTGYNSNIQLDFFYYQSPYNLTFLGLNLAVLGLSYIGLTFMAAITLFISSKGKNPFICVILSALVLYIPMIDLSGISHIADKIIALFPVNIMKAIEIFELGKFYNLFGTLLLQPTMMIVTAILISAILVRSTYKSFENHQV
ncbi:hypothetical protein JFL43_16950 [Viridibacillus sp. YIM B01967]|uniref:ABC transporter permease n=1 Tax=Viridibacillus soli TaxID=2798301 RepID=A0ABS1HB71_9BACL|nr:hypothetical protein [Viridibacillus soli]MBK3496514.1 hypothetical protein [Viridibacillus soli]